MANEDRKVDMVLKVAYYDAEKRDKDPDADPDSDMTVNWNDMPRCVMTVIEGEVIDLLVRLNNEGKRVCGLLEPGEEKAGLKLQ